MPLPSDPRKLLINRVSQAVLYLREYWLISNQIVGMIDSGNLTGLDVNFKLSAAVQVRANLLASIAGSGNADVRAEIAVQYSISNISNEISATNVASNAMLKAMSDLLTVVAAQGQIVTANDTTGQVNSNIGSPESDALRASCVALQAAIANPDL